MPRVFVDTIPAMPSRRLIWVHAWHQKMSPFGPGRGHIGMRKNGSERPVGFDAAARFYRGASREAKMARKPPGLKYSFQLVCNCSRTVADQDSNGKA
jgi:hypothetical protein